MVICQFISDFPVVKEYYAHRVNRMGQSSGKGQVINFILPEKETNQ